MKLVVLCNGELVNKHSDGHNGWHNPFGETLPSIGDTVNLGATNFGRETDIAVGTKYVVVSREFGSYATYNNCYDNASCIITVEEIKLETKPMEAFRTLATKDN